MRSLSIRHGPEKAALLEIQGSLPTEGDPRTFHPKAVSGGTRAAVSQVLWCQFREAAILSMSPRDSLVFIIYLDVRVLMGYSELLLRAPNYLIFV